MPTVRQPTIGRCRCRPGRRSMPARNYSRSSWSGNWVATWCTNGQVA